MGISDLVGKTLVSIEGAAAGSDTVTISLEDGTRFLLRDPNWEDEVDADVLLADVEGDIADLIGSPITLAEAVTSDRPHTWRAEIGGDYSFTWTFYRIATAKGFVVLRWLGESNGNYAEEVEVSVLR